MDNELFELDFPTVIHELIYIKLDRQQWLSLIFRVVDKRGNCTHEITDF